MLKMANLIEDYIEYCRETESPYIYHRWCAIAAIGAIVGRKLYLEFGDDKIHPNLYIMLLGEPAARKSTAIKKLKRMVGASGYDNFGADKTTKEKFLLDLEGAIEDFEGKGMSPDQIYDSVTSQNLWGDGSLPTEPREVFIVADEWNEFTTPGNSEFYTTLGNFWDWNDDRKPFTQRLKNTKSVCIWQPTVSILGGNTPEKFAEAFPPAIIGGGFLSRMLLIHGERSGRKYDIPPTPDRETTEQLITRFQTIRSRTFGAAVVEPSARTILKEIYETRGDAVDDVRFKGYNNRRHTQLLKLCLIIAAGNNTNILGREIVITAHTYLSASERFMARSIGEFGKARNSDVANKIMDVLDKATMPVGVKEIWKHIHQDLDKVSLLADIMQSLQIAERVIYVKDGVSPGYLPKKAFTAKQMHVDWSLLTQEERDALGVI
jgi:hypothetical protein